MAFPPVLLLHGCNPQVVQVTGSSGWSFEFSLRPGSDQALLDKYGIVDCIQVCVWGGGGGGGGGRRGQDKGKADHCSACLSSSAVPASP
jgi:hypothetical protein